MVDDDRKCSVKGTERPTSGSAHKCQPSRSLRSRLPAEPRGKGRKGLDQSRLDHAVETHGNGCVFVRETHGKCGGLGTQAAEIHSNGSVLVMQAVATHCKGSVLATQAVETQGNGVVLTMHAVETQGKGGVLVMQEVETHGKGRCLRHAGSGNARQRRCLTPGALARSAMSPSPIGPPGMAKGQ